MANEWAYISTKSVSVSYKTVTTIFRHIRYLFSFFQFIFPSKIKIIYHARDGPKWLVFGKSAQYGGQSDIFMSGKDLGSKFSYVQIWGMGAEGPKAPKLLLFESVDVESEVVQHISPLVQ